MFITVAGEKKQYDDGITVSELIEKENVENAEYVTVTVNDEFVTERHFPQQSLTKMTQWNFSILWEEEKLNVFKRTA